MGQPSVGRSTSSGWDRRAAIYPGDNLTQEYINVDGYRFNIVRIYAISHPSNPGTPTSFLFVIEDDTYAQVSKIRGATLRVGDREFALARAGAETRVGSTRVFWWDPGNPRWSEGDEVNLQLTVPAETCMEFTDPTPVSQVKLDMGYGWKPRFGVLEGWHTVSGPVNGERYAPVNGDSWADSHRLQSGSASFTYAGRTYELRSVVNNGYNLRMWVEFSSEEPFPDEFAEDLTLVIENEMSYGRWRTTTKRLRDLSTSDYMVDGKHVRRFNWNEPQRRVEARGRVVLLGVFHGNSSYVLVALQNPGEPAIEEFKVNQPPDEKDAFSAGDKILVTLVADQELTIPSDVNPTLDLAFDNPTYPRVATFNHSSSSGKEMVFEYTVQDADTDADTDADGYEIVAGSLRGATGIVSSDDEQLNPRFNCGRNVVAIDGDRLPKIDGVRVSEGGISLKFCPAEVDEGVSFTCYLENTSDESRVVSWAVYADPDHSPPVHEWDNLRVRAADDAGPGGVIIEEPNGWSQAMDSEDDGVVEFRWTLGGLGPGQTAIASFTPQDDQVIEEPKVFKIAWAHASYGSGFAGLGHYVTVLDNEPPARPTGLHAVPSDRQAILNWDDPDDDAITGYEYRYKVGDGDFGPWTDMKGSGATTTHLVTNLTNDVEHTFVIRASSRFGESLESEPATVTPKQFSGDWSYVTVVEPVVLIAEGPDTVSVSVIATYQVRADQVAEVVSMEAVASPEGAEAIFSVPADANGLGLGGLDGTLVSSGAVTIANNPECEHQPIGTLTCELAGIDGLYARPPVLSGDYTVSVSVPDEFALTASVNIDETLPHVPTSAGIPDATLEVIRRPTQPTGFTATAGPEQVLLNWDDPGDASTIMYQYTSGVGEFKLTASDGARRDEFGRSVAMDGDTIVVGAYSDDDNGLDSGSVYVFTNQDGEWSQTAKLTASDGAAADRFGGSVGVDGDTIVVGAYSDDDNGADSGSAYVFTRPATGWARATETAKLTASSQAAGDYFGWSVGVDGDTIVVGASQNYGRRANSGSAYVFTRPAAGWATATETAKLTASDGQAYDHFGGSAGVDRDTIVVGAPRDDTGRFATGSAYVFTKPAAGWARARETAKLTPSDGWKEDRFGFSVGVDGDTIVVGASQDNDNGSNSGSAYVFTKPATGWARATETAKLTASDGAAEDVFGGSAGVDGDTILVGAYGTMTTDPFRARSMRSPGRPPVGQRPPRRPS